MIRFRMLVSAILPIGLCLALLATIYLTQFDWEWLAFLSGVFVAAVLALSSKAAASAWAVARRTRQIEKLKERLALQTALYRAAEERADADHGRNRLLYDSMDALVAFVDAEQICRYHNLAFASAVGRPDTRVSGKSLREILGDKTHSKIGIVLERALNGKGGEFGKTLCLSQTGSMPYSIRIIPNSQPNGAVSGCWLLLDEAIAGDAGRAEAALVIAMAKARSATGGEATEQPSAEEYYLQSMSEDLTGWADPKARFLLALEQDEFCMLYQPIRPASADIAGPDYAEILVRLQEEETSLLPPGAFFPVAERYGLMSSLDRWVVGKLLRWDKSMPRSGVFTRFCINLSCDSILDETFVDFLRREIEKNNLPGMVLCFELAEADVISHQIDAIRLTGELAAIGSEVTIDGFGGNSISFAYLQKMAVNFLKIDGSIIANIHRDPVSLAKARAITRAAHLTKQYTIAEFVETQDTLDLLRDIGVDYMQGFGIARPRALSDLEKKEGEDNEVEITPISGDQPVMQALMDLELSTIHVPGSKSREPVAGRRTDDKRSPENG
jgi:EAL domain-containing protein (putative c-di-GMP-specific phosphodiesterase class I)/PAS domain-containing protein